jgi:hypothetical protein
MATQIGKFDRADMDRQHEERMARIASALEHPAQLRAMDQLKALLPIPGALKIITNMPDPDGEVLGPRHPAFWICHDVETLEGPDHLGNITATSFPYGDNKRDYCKGNALALLGRLTQAGRAEPFVEDREELPAPKPGILVPKPLSRE